MKSPDYDGDAFSWLVGAIKTHWKLIMLLTATCLGVAGALAILMTKIYRSEVLLVPVIGQSIDAETGGVAASVSGVAARLGIGVGARPGAAFMAEQEALATLTSRSFLDSWVEERSLLPVLFADKFDLASGTWIADEPSDVPSAQDAYELLTDQVLSVSQDVRNGLVTLAVEWRDPQLAAEWANEIVNRANDSMRRRAISEAHDSEIYLEAELAKTEQVGVRESIYRLIESNIGRAAIANIRQEYAFRVIDPAAVSDRDHYVRPKKLVLLVIGLAMGLFLGVIAAAFGYARSQAVDDDT